MVRDRFVDIGLLRALGREVARRLDAEVDGTVRLRLGKGRGEVDRPLGERSRPIRLRRDRARRARAGGSCPARRPSPGPVLVIVLDRLAPRLERLVGAAVAQDQVILAEMIEQGRKPLLEQRQPMLHPGHPAAVGQRLVERVLGRGGAELLAIARAEALDRLGVEQRLRRRHQGEGLGLVGRALVGGVEAAHRCRSRRRRNRAAAPAPRPAGKRSISEPRTAYSPCSATVSARW